MSTYDDRRSVHCLLLVVGVSLLVEITSGRACEAGARVRVRNITMATFLAVIGGLHGALSRGFQKLGPNLTGRSLMFVLALRRDRRGELARHNHRDLERGTHDEESLMIQSASLQGRVSAVSRNTLSERELRGS